MSKLDQQTRKRIIRANDKIREIQTKLEQELVGKRVKLLGERRGHHSRRRYQAGSIFIVYLPRVYGDEVGLWLSREDSLSPSFELSVWLREVEFIPEKQS